MSKNIASSLTKPLNVRENNITAKAIVLSRNGMQKTCVKECLVQTMPRIRMAKIIFGTKIWIGQSGKKQSIRLSLSEKREGQTALKWTSYSTK